jgi:hypothetical protein
VEEAIFFSTLLYRQKFFLIIAPNPPVAGNHPLLHAYFIHLKPGLPAVFAVQEPWRMKRINIGFLCNLIQP